MADNTTIMAGVTIRTDELAGGIQEQVVKIALGADGVEDLLLDSGQQAANASLPVVIASNQSAVPTTIKEAYAPVGSHSSGASIAEATTLTKPEGASQIIIQALTQNVRFTLDATTPTTTVGFQLLAGNPPSIIAVPGTGIKVIQEAATASLQYQWVS